MGGLSDLLRFLETVYVFFFIFRILILILILYTTDFNPRINKDIIFVIIIMKPNIFRIKYALPMIQATTTTNV